MPKLCCIDAIASAKFSNLEAKGLEVYQAQTDLVTHDLLTKCLLKSSRRPLHLTRHFKGPYCWLPFLFRVEIIVLRK